ncbi:pyridoxamine 5-phosphate oxidase [Saccharothrix sp. 6-C]|uniref:pyridoxamine 5'-phosphate oxidase family protein n=1 Tax=Saccharothrix sp. 6-C TaxID=2781735 RepID=UPI0019171E5B|nr:pyridoxamine 5'-phosphate oxidase family protein [Saccharothrix sp. 6-C]QQQ77533.1 pyridoxamine 5-phosphate oxidase [Saccharothrix sp. 6-C]
MPRTMTDAERDEFLGLPHVAVLSVAADDRPPLTVPVFYAHRDGLLTFFTGTQGRTARKTRLLERAGAFSLCVQQPTYPYKYVTAECVVHRADRAPSTDDVHAVTSRYLPQEAARAFAEAETAAPSETFVLFTGRPVRWLTSDFGEPDGPGDQGRG